MSTLGELFGLEFKNSESKKFTSHEKQLIDEFFDLLKNKFKGAKLKNSYYYNKYSDWYPYLFTDDISKNYKIERRNYTFEFRKLHIEGKNRISKVSKSRGQANSLVEEYVKTFSLAERKRMSSSVYRSKGVINQSDLKLITAIHFYIRPDQGISSSDYFYIPTRYNINDEQSSGLTEACVKNIRKIYFPKMIRLFKKCQRKSSALRWSK
jgi:hypothetical protein